MNLDQEQQLQEASDVQADIIKILKDAPSLESGITAMANLFIYQATESEEPEVRAYVLSVLKQSIKYIEGGPDIVRMGKWTPKGKGGH